MPAPRKDNPRKFRETFLVTKQERDALGLASRRLRVSKGEVIRQATFEVYLKKVMDKIAGA